MGTFYLALFAHVVLTLYVGTFGTLRTATWMVLIGAWAGSEIATLASYVLPWTHSPLAGTTACQPMSQFTASRRPSPAVTFNRPWRTTDTSAVAFRNVQDFQDSLPRV